MRRILSFLLAPLLCLLALPSAVSAEVGVSAQAAVVMEPESGRVLYQKNADAQLPMASTTKIMTALVALEQGNLDETLEISSAAAGVEGSSMYLEVGETMTLRELLYGLMLSSGNDAAVAIAERFGGVEAFVEQMNQKAAEIGADRSHFANPNGLPDETHYSSAADMARITARALQNPTFAEIVATKSYRIAGEGKSYPRVLNNHNKLLRLCDGCIGVKTGFTKAAGRCLVSAARRDGMTLICVTLNAPDDWNDHCALYDAMFSAYHPASPLALDAVLGEIPITGSDVTSLPYGVSDSFVYPLSAQEKLSLSFAPDTEIAAPIQEGDPCGTVSILLGDTVLKTLSLTVRGNAEKHLIPETVKRGLRLNLGSIYWSWLTLLSTHRR